MRHFPCYCSFNPTHSPVSLNGDTTMRWPSVIKGALGSVVNVVMIIINDVGGLLFASSSSHNLPAN